MSGIRPKTADIGGQAVLEGVMMRSPDDGLMAVAVRKDDGNIEIFKQAVTDAAKANRFFALPIVRGIVNFVAMLKLGYTTISISAKMYGLEDEEPSRLEKWLAEKLGKSSESIVMGIAMVLAVVLAAGLFILLPSFVAQLAKRAVENRIFVNLIEGGARLVIFLGYMAAVSLMPDIRRVFAYHGAEHKTINCFESGKKLTIANAQSFTTRHPRCGTSFLLIVMVISILFFSLIYTGSSYFMRVLSRLLLMPLVAGISYEALKYLGRHDNALIRLIRAPGMWLQALTTREPDDNMVEVAIAAFNACTEGRFASGEAAAEPENAPDSV